MKRSEVAKEYTWDLESIYPTDEAWDADFTAVEKEIGAISAYAGKLNDKASLRACLALSDDLDRRLSLLYAYAHMRKDQDTSDAKYNAMQDRIFSLYMGFSAKSAFLSPELSALDDAYLDDVIADPAFSDWDYRLAETKRSKKHILSEKEEKLLALSSVPLSGFSDVFGKINNVDVPMGTITVNGKKEKLTHGKYSYFLQHPDQRVRKAAFTTFYAGFNGLINTLCATYAGSVKKDNFYAKARGYDDCMQMKMDNENVPKKVYNNLISCVKSNLKYVHRYVSLRKKMMGVRTLNMYDMYVSIAKTDLSVPFDEAFEMVKKGLKPLGEEYAALLQSAKDDRWMDVFETDNKRSGAYSSGSFGTKPFVLLNYSNTAHDVFTVAHELGHSIHTYYSCHNQPYAKSGYEIFVAEVASTVNEVLLLKDMIASAKDKEIKKYLLSYYLDMFRTTLFRQTMFAEFEKIAHEMDDRNEALTPESLNAVYLALNKKYYGRSVKHNPQIATEWSRIPHFYTSFYVYKYATGITSAVSIARNILADPSYVEKYKKFLSAGSSTSPYEVLKLTGVDLAQKAPFEAAMAEFRDTLEQLEKIDEE